MPKYKIVIRDLATIFFLFNLGKYLYVFGIGIGIPMLPLPITFPVLNEDKNKREGGPLMKKCNSVK